MRPDPRDVVFQKLLERIEILGTISSSDHCLTRIFLSREMDTASRLIQSWMNSAGLITQVDGMQNVVGSWPSENAQSPSLHIGSHYDTVINAGKYDGTLGLLLSIAAVELLQQEGYQPRHFINVLGFCDEEGIRFSSTFLGSSYLCGAFDLGMLHRKDRDGITMGAALEARGFDTSSINRPPALIQEDDIFLETHIEQGPILESLDLPLGVVDGIAAQMRIKISLTGKSGHAGTTPFPMRKDALVAASEMILAVETLFAQNPNARATVGYLNNQPNAINAISGEVDFTIDLRHPVTAGLNALFEKLESDLRRIARNRSIEMEIDVMQRTESIECDRDVQKAISKCISRHQKRLTSFTSGAGHDTLKIAQTCRAGMMFVRCRDGLSHHPDEYTDPSDIRSALDAWVDVIREIDQNFPSKKAASSMEQKPVTQSSRS
ncbi:M20 family metallo-hydrolase [Pelagicoccus sp. SDUM812003]|uniref:M20 family metallo-hydrolase n=1 Tax=Pelagicoccus sp. SDUM812003 TaxID=3041267 RepID=UPI00280F51F9|nr:M20 family metallo-hydrolase [Pelagicoccus sp. SDUM812003]MDQ8205469.1 M20 family metallo-hydrolase [Pelagicoccus sp. SDUM812003]